MSDKEVNTKVVVCVSKGKGRPKKYDGEVILYDKKKKMKVLVDGQVISLPFYSEFFMDGKKKVFFAHTPEDFTKEINECYTMKMFETTICCDFTNVMSFKTLRKKKKEYVKEIAKKSRSGLPKRFRKD